MAHLSVLANDKHRGLLCSYICVLVIKKHIFDQSNFGNMLGLCEVFVMDALVSPPVVNLRAKVSHRIITKHNCPPTSCIRDNLGFVLLLRF